MASGRCAALVIALAILAAVALPGTGSGPAVAQGAALPTTQRPLPAFTLTDHTGKPFSSRRLKGRAYAIFFGFTNCPDVCPTTLLEMSNHLAGLGRLANKVTVLFVTVDPERDTIAHLGAFLAAFDKRIIGLTGSDIDIASVAQAYKASYEKVPTSSGYTMNHSAGVFLFDRKGRPAGVLVHSDSEAEQRSKLRRAIRR